MGERVVIGLDVGDHEHEDGCVRARRVRGRHRTGGDDAASGRGPGAVEQDPHELLESAFTAVGRCVERAGVGRDGVAAIAVTGQMAGVLGDRRATGSRSPPYDSWLDGRCAPQLRRLAAEHGDSDRRAHGLPADARPRAEDAVVARRAPGRIRAYRRVRDAGASTSPACSRGCRPTAAFIDRTYLHFTGRRRRAHRDVVGRAARRAGARRQQASARSSRRTPWSAS